jgi:hypothetical protein
MDGVVLGVSPIANGRGFWMSCPIGRPWEFLERASKGSSEDEEDGLMFLMAASWRPMRSKEPKHERTCLFSHMTGCCLCFMLGVQSVIACYDLKTSSNNMGLHSIAGHGRKDPDCSGPNLRDSTRSAFSPSVDKLCEFLEKSSYTTTRYVNATIIDNGKQSASEVPEAAGSCCDCTRMAECVPRQPRLLRGQPLL